MQNLSDVSLALLEFVARVRSLLSQLLFAPFEFYVKVMVDNVMGASERAAACYEEKLLERIRWMVRACAGAGRGRGVLRRKMTPRQRARSLRVVAVD